MKLEFTRIRAEDAPLLGKLHVQAWRQAYAGIVPQSHLDALSTQQCAEVFQQELESGTEEQFYFVKIGQISAGFLIFGPSRDEDQDGRTGEIRAIYLLKPFWGVGSGRQMMEFALRRLEKDHFARITLWVLAENTRAVKFYTKAGFIPDGQHQTILAGKPLDGIRLVYQGKSN